MRGLKHRIYNYLANWYEQDSTHWEHGGELERLAICAGYKASNASRRCRELAEDGKIERKTNEKGHVLYRYIPLQSRYQNLY